MPESGSGRSVGTRSLVFCRHIAASADLFLKIAFLNIGEILLGGR